MPRLPPKPPVSSLVLRCPPSQRKPLASWSRFFWRINPCLKAGDEGCLAALSGGRSVILLKLLGVLWGPTGWPSLYIFVWGSLGVSHLGRAPWLFSMPSVFPNWCFTCQPLVAPCPFVVLLGFSLFSFFLVILVGSGRKQRSAYLLPPPLNVSSFPFSIYCPKFHLS